jgi:hypothetical protein
MVYGIIQVSLYYKEHIIFTNDTKKNKVEGILKHRITELKLVVNEAKTQ